MDIFNFNLKDNQTAAVLYYSDALWRPVATLNLNLDLGLEINSMVVSGVLVDSEQRRRGLGKLLLQQAESYALSVGVKTLYAIVHHSNEASIALFRDSGFTESILMEKQLEDG